MAAARFRHLQAFASIAELGSAKRAADAIGLTQPGVTNLVADLEQLIGCTLFLRHARGMRLTDIGRELLPFVRRALASLEAGMESVALRHLHARGIVRIGAIQGAVCGLLVRALPAFGRAKPDILVELREADSAQSSALIAGREIDLMLCREPAVLPEGWGFLELLPDRLVVAAGPQHPMASRRRLQIADLLDERWHLLPAPTGSSRRLEELMARHGIDPHYGSMKTRSIAMTLALLQCERLLLLVPYSVVRQQVELGQLMLLDVVDTPALQALGLLQPREDLGEAALALVDFLCRFVQQHP